MAPALVLTQEAADALGWQGAGPFTFAGVFPGEYLPDEPIEIRFLGFDGEDDATDAYDAAFGDLELAPLEWVEVEPGEGLPIRQNHALSEQEARDEQVEVQVEQAEKIRTHADADAVAADLGISFPADAKLDAKREAIATFRASGAQTGTVAGDPDELIPAVGAEDTTPQAGEAGRTAPPTEESPE